MTPNAAVQSPPGSQSDPVRHLSPIPHSRELPFVGNLFQLDAQHPIQSMTARAEADRPIFSFSVFGHRIIVLSGEELVAEACDESRFHKRLSAPLVELRALGGDGLFTAHHGEPNWVKAHRILVPAFGAGAIRRMFDDMDEVCQALLDHWDGLAPGASVDVADNMTRLTLDTIALTAFDYRFASFERDDMHPFIGAMLRALKQAHLRPRRGPLRPLARRANRQFEADVAMLYEVADGVIAERRADPRVGERGDLLDRMITAADPQTGELLDDENIRYQLITFLIAGHETTSGLLSFALYYLLRNPDCLAKARAQIDEVVGDRPLELADLARLPYLDWVMKEALRFWPTAPAFGVGCDKPEVIGGRYQVMPGDQLLVLLPALHRDPEVWEDPERFDPERFSPERAATLPKHAWLPFGSGRRACIGRRFALQEAHLVLARVLQRYDLTLADPDYQLVVQETLTLKPANLRVIPTRRPGRYRPPPTSGRYPRERLSRVRRSVRRQP